MSSFVLLLSVVRHSNLEEFRLVEGLSGRELRTRCPCKPLWFQEQVTAKVEVCDEDGKLVSSSTGSDPVRMDLVPAEVHHYLQEWSGPEEIPALCDYCLKQLEAFVSRIRKAYP